MRQQSTPFPAQLAKKQSDDDPAEFYDWFANRFVIRGVPVD
jgi:hypothetical protein